MNSSCRFQVPCQTFLDLRPLAGASSGQEVQVLLALAEAVQLVVAYFLVQLMRQVGQRIPIQPAALRQQPPAQILSVEAFSQISNQLIPLPGPQLLPVGAELRQREVANTYESQSLPLLQRQQGPLPARPQQVTYSLLPK
jgi:hypothetical protein